MTVGSGAASSRAATAPSGGNEMATAMGLQLQAANIRLTNAQADKLEAEAINEKEGIKDNLQADLELKQLKKVIEDYTGKELKDYYELVKKPNRGIETKTYQDELEAKQAIATTLYDLWQTGKLEEKSLAEIEKIHLENAKSRAEKRNIDKTFEILEENLKGKKLENVILELEADLQKKTGLDKNSPTWAKLIGRLFLGLTSR